MSWYVGNEWRLWYMSGDYYLDISSVFSAVNKKIWLCMLWLWHTSNSDWCNLCIWICVCVCGQAYKNRRACFTFKPPITISFLKFCQNYLIPRNQFWDHRLLSLDQVYFGVFLIGAFFFLSKHWKIIYFKVGSRFFFGMHILFCIHMWFVMQLIF